MAGACALGHLLPPFPGHWQGAESEVEPTPIWDAGGAGSGFPHYATMVALGVFILLAQSNLYVLIVQVAESFGMSIQAL